MFTEKTHKNKANIYSPCSEFKILLFLLIDIIYCQLLPVKIVLFTEV